MTQYNEVAKVGPVTVTEIVAEFLDTPVSYALDCDYVAGCEWAMFGVPGPLSTTVMEYAQIHADFHAVQGPKSTAWRDVYAEDDDTPS